MTSNVWGLSMCFVAIMYILFGKENNTNKRRNQLSKKTDKRENKTNVDF